MNRINNNKAFTLIELVIVIAIIGIFATITLPRYANMSDKAKVSASKAALGTVRSAIMLSYNSNLAAGLTPVIPVSIFPSMFQNSQIPQEPQTGSSSITFVSDPSLIGEGSGWAYDAAIGRAWINNSQFSDY